MTKSLHALLPRLIFLLYCLPLGIWAQNTPATAGKGEVALRISVEGGNFSRSVTLFLFITFLTFLPMMILTMTSFLRISIVLNFLKQAMGVQQAPSARTITAIALFLTMFIMTPTWQRIYEEAILPFQEKKITDREAFTRGIIPLKQFMLRQTRENTLLMFMELAGIDAVDKMEDLPLRVVAPAFMLSELKTAFQMGFLIYLPFLVVDMVIATILMSMGMMMLPPMMISVPFKILLFIMFDGWNLIVKSLITSFY